MEQTYDCVVLGAGVAGLGAALTMKDAGLNVCVLEKESRVGGRMTTDRMHGFVIDRGVTILGNEFRNLKALVRRFSLQKHVSPIQFSFGVVEDDGLKAFRAKRVDDLLFHHDFRLKTRMALARLGMDVMLNRNRLRHGKSAGQGDLDKESVAEYMARIGGDELQDRILAPGMTCAFGGHFEENSRLILLQTFRNILLTGSWTIDAGVDLIPEAMAKQFPVKFNREVASVAYGADGVRIDTAGGETFFSRSVVIALPGHLVPELCGGLPGNVSLALSGTRYGKMTNAHLGMNGVVPEKYFGMSLSKNSGANFILELEHNRCRALCPEGKCMVSIFWYDRAGQVVSDMDDGEIDRQINGAMTSCLPDQLENIAFRHVVRWDTGIAHFPVGRLRKMGDLRREMETWDPPVQLCGDYLDGISSEGALQTGIEAGRNMIAHLNRK